MAKTLVIPDMHVPFHDQRAWRVMLNVAKVWKPDTVVFIGDFADFFAVSSFPKQPDRRRSLKSEIDVVRRELRRMLRYGDTHIFCEGNHENRLERYLCDKAPELYGLVSSKDLLLDGAAVKWVPYREHIRLGKVLYSHDLGYSGVYAGRHTLEAAGTNVVFGHTHRAGLVFTGTHLDERRFSLNVGWGGDKEQIDYMHRVRCRDWQSGFGLLTTDDRTGLVWPQFVPIIRGAATVDGRVIRA